MERKINLVDINKVIDSYNDDQKWDELVIISSVLVNFAAFVVCIKNAKCSKIPVWPGVFGFIGTTAGTAYVGMKLIVPNTKYGNDLNTLKRKIVKGQKSDYFLVNIGGFDELRVGLSRLQIAANDL